MPPPPPIWIPTALPEELVTAMTPLFVIPPAKKDTLRLIPTPADLPNGVFTTPYPTSCSKPTR